MKKILIINGPNLDSHGNWESGEFVTYTLESINNRVLQRAESLGVTCEFIQKDTEGGLVTAIQNALAVDGVILNVSEFSHYSIAIRDAIASIKTPVVEVHLVNTHKREAFRWVSMISSVCLGSIAGFGSGCYVLALYALAEKLGIMESI